MSGGGITSDLMGGITHDLLTRTRSNKNPGYSYNYTFSTPALCAGVEQPDLLRARVGLDTVKAVA
jgi:hypothetical protein